MDAIHIINAESAGWAASLAFEQCIRDGRLGSRAILLGETDSTRQLRLPTGARVDRIAPLLRRPALAARRVAALIKDAPAVVVWGSGAAAAVRRIDPPCPTATYLSSTPDAPAPGLVVATEHIARTVGVDRTAVALPAMARTGATTRDAQRAAWGLTGDEIVVGMLHDFPEDSSAGPAHAACSILALAGRRTALVVPLGARQILRAIELEERLAAGVRIIVEDSPMPAWLPACDVALRSPAPNAPHASVSWRAARTLGIPRAAPSASLEGDESTHATLSARSSGQSLAESLLLATELAPIQPIEPAPRSQRVTDALIGALESQGVAAF